MTEPAGLSFAVVGSEIGDGDAVGELVGVWVGVAVGVAVGEGVGEVTAFGCVVHAASNRTRTSNARIVSSVSRLVKSGIRLGRPRTLTIAV
jgi:hypothetical protein